MVSARSDARRSGLRSSRLPRTNLPVSVALGARSLLPIAFTVLTSRGYQSRVPRHPRWRQGQSARLGRDLRSLQAVSPSHR